VHDWAQNYSQKYASAHQHILTTSMDQSLKPWTTMRDHVLWVYTHHVKADRNKLSKTLVVSIRALDDTARLATQSWRYDGQGNAGEDPGLPPQL